MNLEPQLFCINYEPVEGIPAMRCGVESTDLFVWAVVNKETGEVDMTDITGYEKGQYALNQGYEWRRFRLVPE